MRRKLLILAALAAALVGLLWSQWPQGSGLPGQGGPAQAQVGVEDRVQRNASADLTLSTVMTDVPGLNALLDTGNWKIDVCLLFSEQGTGDEGQSAAFVLVVGVITQPGAGVVRLYDGQLETVCFNWLIDLTSDTTVKVQARKSGGGGESKVLSGNLSSRLVGTEEP